MKHLILILEQLYPNRMFSLKEEYTRDEVYYTSVEYSLNIEEVIIKSFKSFQDLEKCIYALYERDGLNKERRI